MTSSKEFGATFSNAMDSASGGIRRAMESTADAVRPALDQVSSSTHHAVDRIGEAATDLTNELAHQRRLLQSTQARMTKQCLASVHERPVAALGIAMASGFILGWLFHKK